jgi:hypothetical protein
MGVPMSRLNKGKQAWLMDNVVSGTSDDVQKIESIAG